MVYRQKPMFLVKFQPNSVGSLEHATIGNRNAIYLGGRRQSRRRIVESPLDLLGEVLARCPLYQHFVWNQFPTEYLWRCARQRPSSNDIAELSTCLLVERHKPFCSDDCVVV